MKHNKRRTKQQTATQPMRKACIPLQAKADTTKRIISGYASVFDVLDNHGEVVMPGAFTKSLEARFKTGKIKVLWQHDQTKPIGIPIEMREDSKGLFVSARISETKQGDDALRLIADGVVDSFSIGYEVVRSSKFEDAALRSQLSGFAAMMPMRKLEEIKLYEFSPVTFPANEAARIIAVKSKFGWLPGFDAKTIQAVKSEHGVTLSGEQADMLRAAFRDALTMLDAAPAEPADETEPAADEDAGDKSHESAGQADAASSAGLPSVADDAVSLDAKAAEVGDFVSWENGQGRVTAIDEENETALVQVFADGAPTDAVETVPMSELTVTDQALPESTNMKCRCRQKGNKGDSLGSALDRMIDAMVDDDTSRADVVAQLARAGGISSSTMNQIINGSITCPPERRLAGFARVLGVSLSSLISAAEKDGCSYGDDDEKSIDDVMQKLRIMALTKSFETAVK